MERFKNWYFRDEFIQFLLGNSFFDWEIRRWMFVETLAAFIFCWFMVGVLFFEAYVVIFKIILA